MSVKTGKERRVAARDRGWERKTARAGLGFWRLGGLGPGFGLLSRYSKHFYFAKQFWQLILENGDDCLDKIFSGNF